MTTTRHDLIWDVDGTLFDTYPAFARALTAALADFGVRAAPGEIAPLLYESLGGATETLAARHGLDAEAVDASFGQHYRRALLRDQRPFPGVVDVCTAVLDSGGANYIVTHRGRASLERLLAAYGMDALFTEAICHDDGYPRKPDPAAFLALLARYDLDAGAVLAVGDRALDIQAAQAAGVRACLFGPEPLPDLQPDYHIRAYPELHAILFPCVQTAG